MTGADAWSDGEEQDLFAWHPWGIPGALVLVLGWILAAFVYRASPGRAQNRRLAVLLLVESAVGGITGGVMFLASTPRDTFAWQSLGDAFIPLVAAAYLSFLALLDTPLTRWLRPLPLRALLWAAALGGAAYVAARPHDFVDTVVALPAGGYETVLSPRGVVLFLSLTPVYLFALAAAVATYVAAPRGSASRRRAGWYALAFGVKDAGLVLLFLLITSASDATLTVIYSVVVGQTALLAYVSLLAYGLLREQVLDIDLRVKATISRGAIGAAFVAVFLVVSQVVENVVDARFGVISGGVAAGLLLFAFRPLERAADRVAGAAMPRVRDTPEYRERRGREIYRAAYESARQDGVVSEKERDVLATLQEQLGLSPTEARAIERDVAAAGG